MPDPAILVQRARQNHRIETIDNYHAKYFNLYCKRRSYIKNKIMYPPGRSPREKIRIQTVENLKQGFLRSFLCIFGKGYLFALGFTAK